ncbi:hypothetical protein [Paenibacillus hamazuiensis]|uniref:hypothetical protein n=1 Tax=Paenibacillus hamazuiensis TaxID=2936508 RepID=UPI00200CA8D2|nr:hypothetical protein [Paenibacillus hamazuiensis]
MKKPKYVKPAVLESELIVFETSLSSGCDCITTIRLGDEFIRVCQKGDTWYPL